MEWSVYMILCEDGSLYTGITTDVERRFRQHQTGQGAKFFRSRQPVKLAYQEAGHDRASASRRECEIKRLLPAQKRSLVEQCIN